MDDELLQDFITEANDHLSDIEADLLTIEVWFNQHAPTEPDNSNSMTE